MSQPSHADRITMNIKWRRWRLIAKKYSHSKENERREVIRTQMQNSYTSPTRQNMLDTWNQINQLRDRYLKLKLFNTQERSQRNLQQKHNFVCLVKSTWNTVAAKLLLEVNTHIAQAQTRASIPPEAMARSPQDGRMGPPFFIIMHFKCCADRWHDLPVL